jgi:predicted SAM-dependent methyltransferase
MTSTQQVRSLASLGGVRRSWVERFVARVNRMTSPWLGPIRLRRAARQRPLRIVVGSSGFAPAGWVATDAEYLDLTDRNMWLLYFKPQSVDAILAEHVWEHLTPSQAVAAVATCREFLAPTGYLRIAVPDAANPDPEYQSWVRPGGIGPGADDHKVIYNAETLTQLLEGAGFAVRRLEWFDDHGRFHEEPWEAGDGRIERSRRFDLRNADGVLRYTSLIVDARPRSREK